MRVLVQRMASGQVTWPEGGTKPCGPGLLSLVGFREGDEPYVLEPMAEKLLHLRVFDDESGRMNRSLLETGGTLLLVPQFTLYADCRKGRRPSYTRALASDAAQIQFERFVRLCAGRVPDVQSGRFGAHMQVYLVNDGPVTLLLDSDELAMGTAQAER